MMKSIIASFLLTLLISTHLSATLFNAHRAGSWYPADKQELTNLLNQMSNAAQQRFAMQTDHAQIRALIAPHAGYSFSGIVAAAVYNLVEKNEIDRTIILAPSHFIPLNGIAAPLFSRYRIPTGTLSVDRTAIQKIANDPLIIHADAYFTPEHSVEMQLPFIQRALPRVPIMPLIVGSLDNDQVARIASLLKQCITPKTLVVVSSDFTHYGKNFQYVPFTNHVLLNIDQLDSSVLQPIQHQERAGFESIINKTHDTVCGYNPIRILLELIHQNAFGRVATRLVAHDTSYPISHDDTNVVSYAGLIVTTERDNDQLNQQEQRSLLTYARTTLQEAFKQTISPALIKPIMTPLLEKPQGSFPTIWALSQRGKQLRGCVGQVYPDGPLYAVVGKQILESAFGDNRFAPMQASELPNTQIQISVLKTPKPIPSYKDIILHKHGIILTSGNYRALFLPTVPAEHGFTLTKTLEELSLKAGLPKDAWLWPTTTYQVFEAQDFEETH